MAEAATTQPQDKTDEEPDWIPDLDDVYRASSLWLTSGDVDRFVEQVRRDAAVTALRAAARTFMADMEPGPVTQGDVARAATSARLHRIANEIEGGTA